MSSGRDKIYERICYYQSLEQDLSQTSQYVEPRNQENVYSFEFAKLLILSCVELESVFKELCLAISGSSAGDIGTYKQIVLCKYPNIISASVIIPRLGKTIEPFEGWDVGPLSFWNAYQQIKHSRSSHFDSATYLNAVYALGALYIAILYLARVSNYDVDFQFGRYITSKYCPEPYYVQTGAELPDF